MKQLPGYISSIDPPKVTAEVKEPKQKNFVFLSGWSRAMDKYYKAIEPMLIEDTRKSDYFKDTIYVYLSKIIGDNEVEIDAQEIKLHQKVLFVRTGDKTCKINKLNT